MIEQRKYIRFNIFDFSIAVYIFLVMISSSTGSLLTKIARIELVVMMGLFFLRYMRITKIVIPYIMWNLVFLIYCFLGSFQAFSRTYAIDYTLTLMFVIICNTFIVIYLSENIKKVNLVLKTIIAGALCKALFCYMQNGFLVFMNSREVGNISANAIGFYCAFACVIGLYFSKYEKSLIYKICILLSIAFTILSGSRKAILYILIPIAVNIALESKNPLKILRNIFIACIIVCVSFFLVMNVNFLYIMVGNRIESAIIGILGLGVTDASTKTRLLLISDGIEWFKQRPIFGYGLSNYKALRAAYYPTNIDYYAHNSYIELLVNCGIVGTAIFYSLHFSLLVKAKKRWRDMSKMSLMLFGMLISILVCDYGMVTYYSIFAHLILMLVFLTLNKSKEQEYELIAIERRKAYVK